MADKRIGLIGAGIIGQTHIETIARTDGFRLAAVIEPSPQGAARAEAAGAQLFPSVEALIEARAIDGAIVASPTETHADIAIALLEAGLPVLLEKPITGDLTEATRLLQAAARAPAPMLIGHHRRHNPIIEAAKQAIDSGAIGDLVMATVTATLMKPADYFEPEWRRRAGVGGTLLINLIHEIDLLRHFFGDIGSVSAAVSNATRGLDVEDTAAAVLRFERAGLAIAAQSDAAVGPWAWDLTSGENPARFPTHEATTHCYAGTKGGLGLPDLTLWTHDGAPSWLNRLKRRRLDTADGDAYVRQLRHFGALIDGAATPLVTGVDGAKNLAVIDAIRRANATGSEATVDNQAIEAAAR